MEVLRGVYDAAWGRGPRTFWLNMRLHAPTTAAALLGAAALSAARQLLGNPIECALRPPALSTVPDDALNTFCWVRGTTTVPWAQGGAYPGVAPGVGGSEGALGQRRHSYYQWVPMMLLLQVRERFLPLALPASPSANYSVGSLSSPPP